MYDGGSNNMTIYRCTNKLCDGYENNKLEEVEICVGTMEEPALLCSLCDDVTLYSEAYDEEIYLEAYGELYSDLFGCK
jgi:hypothetical protein